MSYSIRKVGVIGAGTMGSGIAALLAGVGIPTILLDIPASESSPDDDFKIRNAPALKGLERLKKSRPPELFDAADLSLITVGNTDDHMDWLRDADWVIEVVVEKLDVKRDLFGKLHEIVKPTAILSTNTSGLPIADIAEGMGSSFTRRFMGTHFFNPPRYLRLLEVIPHEQTDPEIVRFMQTFATQRLGKGVVIAKDEPNFIGNRFMSMLLSQILNYTIDNGLTVEEIDNLTGTLIGRPKTGTFRLSDLVGNDVVAHINHNLYPAIPTDPDRDVLVYEPAKAIYDHLMAEGWLGNKTGQGFYKRVNKDDGSKEFWTLDLNTMEYQPPQKVRFNSVGKHRKVEDTGERIRLLLGEEDKAAKFLWHHHAFYLTYASKRVPEITETIVNVDNAQKWGFAHDLGPFEIWDALGVAESLAEFESEGYIAANWVHEMLDASKPTFYQRDDSGKVMGYYSPQEKDYVALEPDIRVVYAATLKADNCVVKQNSGANILDMGDGIALLEMTTDNYVIDDAFVEMGFEAVDLLNNGEFRGLVIGHDGERFCVGANILLMLMAAQSGELGQIEQLVKGLQDFTMALRYAHAPVVVAGFNMALGGGVEMLMGGDAIVCHMELYTGLVEFGVGIVPAGGGAKEMMRRALNPVMRTKNAEVLPHIQKIFEQIAFAKVSSSAKEAREMQILAPSDRIVMNRAHLLSEAKRTASYLAEDYVAPQPEKIYAAGRDVYAALLIAIDGMVRAKYASEHDALIARKLAWVLTGAAVSDPTWVNEQVILDLEREAFIELLKTEKTQDRMRHMLQTNKPLRN